MGDINTIITDKTKLFFNFISNIVALDLKIDLREFCDTFLNKWNIEKSPVNANIKVLDYWHQMRITFPLLFINAKEILLISCGSLDAERSFSKFRNVKSCKTTLLKPESLKVYSVMHFNDDI